MHLKITHLNQVFQQSLLLISLFGFSFSSFSQNNHSIATECITCKDSSIVLDNSNVAGSIGSPNALYSEGFEYNSVSDEIAWPHNAKWNTLTGTEDGSGTVTNAKSNGGSKSLFVSGNNDFVLKFPQKTSGKYLIKWKVLIPTGSTAIMNVSQDSTTNSNICKLAFNGGNSAFFNDVDAVFLGQSPYSSDEWFDVAIYLNLDTNRVLILVNNTIKGDFIASSYNFSALNFKQGGAGYYIDDIELQDLDLVNQPLTYDSESCNLLGTYIDPLYFDCSNVGNYTVSLTSIDINGATTVCQSTVTIKDEEAPISPTLVDVSGECSASATAPTTNDNCSGTITGTTSDPLTYSTPGTHVITWTFTDNSGNTSTAYQNVIINDTTAPTPDLDSLPEITAEGSVTPSTPTATDNCNGAINGTCPTAFPITSSTIITWTYTDNNGNSTSQNQSIVIVESQAPIAQLQFLPSIYAECSVIPEQPSAMDNFDGLVYGTTDTQFPITESTIVKWMYTDNQGNRSYQNQKVIIYDDVAPELECPLSQTYPLTDNLATGLKIKSSLLQYLSCTDNCGIHAVNLNYPVENDSVFFPIGNSLVEWTATDFFGNTKSCNFEITIFAPLSTNQNELKNSNFIIYPNPANNKVQLVINNKQLGGDIQILDITGKVLMKVFADKKQQTIDISKLQNGVYFVKLGNIVRKFIKK